MKSYKEYLAEDMLDRIAADADKKKKSIPVDRRMSNMQMTAGHGRRSGDRKMTVAKDGTKGNMTHSKLIAQGSGSYKLKRVT